MTQTEMSSLLGIPPKIFVIYEKIRTGAGLSFFARRVFQKARKAYIRIKTCKVVYVMSLPKKSTLIKKEKAKLTHILESVSPAALETMQGVIDNAAWMRVELDILREDINENGYTTLFQQSDKVPPYDKERVQVQQYDKLLKNYLACIKQLVSRIPDDGQTAALDELQEFMQFRR